MSEQVWLIAGLPGTMLNAEKSKECNSILHAYKVFEGAPKGWTGLVVNRQPVNGVELFASNVLRVYHPGLGWYENTYRGDDFGRVWRPESGQPAPDWTKPDEAE